MRDDTAVQDENTTGSPAGRARERGQGPQSGAGTSCDLQGIFAALRFAADKHRDQRRKGECASPYINHPIEVAEVLTCVGGVTDATLLQAAVLHDTLEDTETTPQELESNFGPAVCRLVEEVSDDKSLAKAERKRLQIERAPGLSAAARQIKLADKICNVRDVSCKPPEGWSLERRIDYLAWSERVVAGCRGVNARLEQEFDQVSADARVRCGCDTQQP